MLTTTINIDGTELNISQDDDIYKVRTEQGDYEIEASQEGLDLLNGLIDITKKIKKLGEAQLPLKIDINEDNEITLTKQDGSEKGFHVSGVAYIDLIEADYDDKEVAQAWNFIVRKLSELNNNRA